MQEGRDIVFFHDLHAVIVFLANDTKTKHFHDFFYQPSYLQYFSGREEARGKFLELYISP